MEWRGEKDTGRKAVVEERGKRKDERGKRKEEGGKKQEESGRQ